VGQKPNQPRLHHYLPRFYLRGFADPTLLKREAKSAIWVYEKGEPTRRGSPDNEARERDFYAFEEEGMRNTQVEEWFARMESEVAPILERLQRREHVLTPDEKEWLAIFAGTMYMRTPAGRKWHDNRVAPATTQYIEMAARNPEQFVVLFQTENATSQPEVDLEDIRKDILNRRLDAIASRPGLNLTAMVEVGRMIAEVLVQFDWQVVHSDGSQFFITSDSPVLPELRDDAKGITYFWMGVERPGVNVWFPISRTVCLRMKRGIGPGLCRLPDRGIRMVNKNLMLCADRRVYAAQRSAALEALFNKIGCKHSLERSEITWEGRKF
jgi:hypothetical protein